MVAPLILLDISFTARALFRKLPDELLTCTLFCFLDLVVSPAAPLATRNPS